MPAHQPSSAGDVDSTSLDGPRPATPEELPAVIELLNYHFRTIKGYDPTIARDYPHIYCPENLDNVLIVRAGAKVICSTGIWITDVQLGDVSLRIGGINCVITEPAYRKRGLGMALMEAAHERMLDAGCHVAMLGTRIPNWYRRLGWELAGRGRRYSLNRGNIALLPKLPADCEFEMAQPGPCPQVLAVHHADKLGGIRTEDTFGRLLVAKRIEGVALAANADKVAAYLLHCGPRVMEWGGPAEVVAGLLRAWFEHLDDRSSSTSDRGKDEKTPMSLEGASLLTPETGHGLVGLLDELRLPCNADYLHLIRLLDPAGILKAFGRDDITVTGSGDTFTLQRGPEKATLDVRSLAKLFFGPERVSDFAGDVFPLPLWHWPLEEV